MVNRLLSGLLAGAGAVLALPACSPPAGQVAAQSTPEPAATVEPEATIASPSPAAEANPKSAAAAYDVLNRYLKAVKDGRADEAAAYWSEASAASSVAAQFGGGAIPEATIGVPGEVEGAAGSLYVEIPVLFGAQGGAAPKEAVAVLRRVNDVPGATAAQLQWRITRIEFK